MGYLVLTIIIVIASILMVGVVLIQQSKGGGLTENFNEIKNFAGAKQSTDIVEKLTWGIMATIAVLSILTVAFTSEADMTIEKSEVNAVAPVTLPQNQPNVEASEAPALDLQQNAE